MNNLSPRAQSDTRMSAGSTPDAKSARREGSIERELGLYDDTRDGFEEAEEGWVQVGKVTT